jgi:uncharacterized protein (DUF58 family)
MVRREEQPRQMRATILLDNRSDAHRGHGSESSLEWAVSVAASAALSLTEQRYGVRLLLDERPAGWNPPFASDGAAQLLDRLAVAEEGGPQVLAGALSVLARTGGDGLVVAVLGEIEEDVATALARVGGRGTRGVALLARTTAWAALPPSRATELDTIRARVMATLRSGGWSVADAGPADEVPLAWARAIGIPGALDLTGGASASGGPLRGSVLDGAIPGGPAPGTIASGRPAGVPVPGPSAATAGGTA